jgi:SAM-dependent methyltransferase
MKDNAQSIHEFDFQMICEYFSGLERQGPGSPEVTIQALRFIDNLTPESAIADLGCGTGGQTLVLAEHAPGRITGLDLFGDFIDILNANSRARKLQDRVKGLVGSMDKLPFGQASLDLIWSEGAIYHIGFERGLAKWREYLKPGGFLAVSEASWFTETRPPEIDRFWKDAYPEIDTIPTKVRQLQQAGYVPMATFILPSTCWTDHFYAPQVAAQTKFLEKHAGNPTAEDLVAYQRHEADLYRQYHAYYGYVFYIGKKIE